jgi:hypothetical protein
MPRARIAISPCTAVFITAAITAVAQQGQPPIGIAPVTVGPSPYVFDTAEQRPARR